MKALRADLAALLKDTGAIAAEQAKAAAAKGRALAEDAGEKAVEYRDAVADKVREHPFAAVGIALAAGFVHRLALEPQVGGVERGLGGRRVRNRTFL